MCFGAIEDVSTYLLITTKTLYLFHVGHSVYDVPKAVRRKPPNPTSQTLSVTII